ncbi:hypothetical protein ACERII_14815 [Evansella sp. AB-rgal1]
MTVTKEDVLRLIDQLSDGELRIVYTLIYEYKVAEQEMSVEDDREQV